MQSSCPTICLEALQVISLVWLIFYSFASINGEDGIYGLWNVIFNEPFIFSFNYLTKIHVDNESKYK